MADLKTRQNSDDVGTFIEAINNPQKQEDSRVLLRLMQDITGEEPKMWGDSIVGFGSYHYKYASGREGEWMLTGFSPRKARMTVYIMDGFSEHQELLKQLGKYKNSVSCLYISKLSDIDLSVLGEIVKKSVHTMRTSPPSY